MPKKWKYCFQNNKIYEGWSVQIFGSIEGFKLFLNEMGFSYKNSTKIQRRSNGKKRYYPHPVCSFRNSNYIFKKGGHRQKPTLLTQIFIFKPIMWAMDFKLTPLSPSPNTFHKLFWVNYPSVLSMPNIFIFKVIIIIKPCWFLKLFCKCKSSNIQ